MLRSPISPSLRTLPTRTPFRPIQTPAGRRLWTTGATSGRSLAGTRGIRSALGSTSTGENRIGSVVRRDLGRLNFRAYATEATSSEGATSAPPKKRRSLLRRLLFYTLFSTLTFYTFGTYSALHHIPSDRFHAFFVESVPFGEQLVDYFEDADMKEALNGLPQPKGSKPDSEEVKRKVEQAAERTRRSVERQKEKVEAAAQGVKEQGKKAKESVKEVAQQAKAEAKKVTASTPKETRDSTTAATSAEAAALASSVKDLTNRAEEALGLSPETAGPNDPSAAARSKPPPSSKPKDGLTPRQLDASPQPPKQSPPKEPWENPLPLGYEPPPGYSSKQSKGRDVTALQAPPPSSAPLPLVAPSIKDLSASEPILGQLAGTIDSLAAFLKDHPTANDTAVGDGGSASEVLRVAEIDLNNLGKRLEKIKEEERFKLEGRLDKQAKEYNGMLLNQEKALIEQLDKQEDDWKHAFDVERRAMVDSYRERLENELGAQEELINQRLKEEVIAQGMELQRRWLREINVRVEEERGGRLGKIQELQAGLKHLERLTLDNSEHLDENVRVQRVWSAVRAAFNQAFEFGSRRPFDNEIRAVRNLTLKHSAAVEAEKDADETLAQGGDQAPHSSLRPELIYTAITSIPENVASTGIESFPDLCTWFSSSLQPSIRRASLFPEHGGFLAYLFSSLASPLLFERKGFVPGDDPMSVLARAEWFLIQRDLERATMEVNQLKGWPKKLARDWLQAARRHLEVQQALELAQTEASLESLLVI